MIAAIKPFFINHIIIFMIFVLQSDQWLTANSNIVSFSLYANQVLTKTDPCDICQFCCPLKKMVVFNNPNFLTVYVDFVKLVVCQFSTSLLVPHKCAIHLQIRELYCTCLEKNIWDSEEYASALQLLR